MTLWWCDTELILWLHVIISIILFSCISLIRNGYLLSPSHGLYYTWTNLYAIEFLHAGISKVNCSLLQSSTWIPFLKNLLYLLDTCTDAHAHTHENNRYELPPHITYLMYSPFSLSHIHTQRNTCIHTHACTHTNARTPTHAGTRTYILQVKGIYRGKVDPCSIWIMWSFVNQQKYFILFFSRSKTTMCDIMLFSWKIGIWLKDS